MFSVFSVTGRVSSGTLEQLRDVAPVRAATRVRAVAGQDPASLADPDEAFVHWSGGGPAGGLAADPRSAMVAYANTQAGGLPRHPVNLVSDVMTTQLTTLRDDAPITEAWRVLADKGVGQAPVLNDQGVLVGLLLRLEMMQPTALPHPANSPAEWLALWRKTVAELMWTPVPSVSPDAELRRVAQALLDWQLPGMPVASEEGNVVGFISRGDILRAVAADPPLDLWG
jgi:CBS domain-containing protein